MENKNYMEEIKEIVEWYHDLSEDFTNVNELMHRRKTLAALVFNFGNLVVGPLGIEAKIAKAHKENEKFGIRVTNHVHGVAKARNISKANSHKERTDQAQAEGDYLSAKHSESSIYKVLDSMNQQIAHLKEELKYSRYTNG